ncbi:MAG: hypothetical protein J6C82_05000 [Clostridia bacterium]|nr:hypothetical protein [Clostridia bacterium]
MKAYKNSKGNILAVFKDENEKYGIYHRKDEDSVFRWGSYSKYPHRATRAEAERDMDGLIESAYDRTWELIELGARGES